MPPHNFMARPQAPVRKRSAPPKTQLMSPKPGRITGVIDRSPPPARRHIQKPEKPEKRMHEQRKAQPPRKHTKT